MAGWGVANLGTWTHRRQSVPNRGICPHLCPLMPALRAVTSVASRAASPATCSLKRWTTPSAAAEGRNCRLASKATPCHCCRPHFRLQKGRLKTALQDRGLCRDNGGTTLSLSMSSLFACPIRCPKSLPCSGLVICIGPPPTFYSLRACHNSKCMPPLLPPIHQPQVP